MSVFFHLSQKRGISEDTPYESDLTKTTLHEVALIYHHNYELGEYLAGC
jgi:hypothetical protein